MTPAGGLGHPWTPGRSGWASRWPPAPPTDRSTQGSAPMTPPGGEPPLDPRTVGVGLEVASGASDRTVRLRGSAPMTPPGGSATPGPPDGRGGPRGGLGATDRPCCDRRMSQSPQHHPEHRPVLGKCSCYSLSPPRGEGGVRGFWGWNGEPGWWGRPALDVSIGVSGAIRSLHPSPRPSPRCGARGQLQRRHHQGSNDTARDPHRSRRGGEGE